MKILQWALVILLAGFLVFMGVQKFGGPNPVFSYIAATTGLGLFEPWVRMVTGVMEIMAAVLLLVPRTRILGGLLSIAVIGGAIAFHLSPFLGINAPIAFDADGEYVKSSALFFMAVGFFAISLVLMYIQYRGKKPTQKPQE